jgi:hypothetical protein
VNWPQVDYWLAPLVGVTEAQRAASLQAARELTLCFVHWLQTDAPRPDRATGYPGLRLCPESWVLTTVWRPPHMSVKAVESRLSSRFWRAMSGWRPVKVLIARKTFRIRSALAAIESICIQAQQDTGIATYPFQPGLSRAAAGIGPWCLCFPPKGAHRVEPLDWSAVHRPNCPPRSRSRNDQDQWRPTPPRHRRSRLRRRVRRRLTPWHLQPSAARLK